MTLCVWGEGLAARLPRTDRIAFAFEDPARDEIVVAWEEAQRIVGHLMTPPAVPGEGWTVSRFPLEEELERLARTLADTAGAGAPYEAE